MDVRELDQDTCRAGYAAMKALRPGLRDADDFAERVADQMRHGYRLVAVFDSAGGPSGDAPEEPSEGSDGRRPSDAIAVAGFRIGRNLAWGLHCYVDDLSTLPAARGRGAASALLEWIHAEADAVGAREVHLDSGVQVERQSAHRLYFARGYRISSYHFSAPMTPRA